MRGYLNGPEQTSQVMRDGWFYTGDLCRWSSDGQLELLDRKRDAIKTRSGALVYASELEHCLHAQFEIKELAIAGISDNAGEDQLVCFVHPIATMSASQLRGQFNQLLREQLSLDHQLTALVYVSSFPRGANDKILKDQLVNHFLQDQMS